MENQSNGIAPVGTGENISNELQSITLYLSPPKKLGSATKRYLETLRSKADKGKASTALRLWVAGAGGPHRSGARITLEEKLAIDTYIQNLDFKKFWTVDPLKTQDRGFKRLKTPRTSQYTYRNELKTIIEFFQSQGWDPHSQRKNKRFRLRNVNGVKQKSGKRVGWQRASNIQLTKQDSPPSLNAEMQAFRDFYLNTLELSANAYDEGFIRRYFGMLVKEGTASLEISLEKLIPYVKSVDDITMTELVQGKVYPDNPVLKSAIAEGRYFEALAVAKEICREEEQAAVNYVLQLIDAFGKYTNCQSKGRGVETTWLLRVVKFVYRHDLRATEVFDDLPVVKALRRKNCKFIERSRQERARVSYEEKSLTRHQVWD
jgi:hypothetical protein